MSNLFISTYLASARQDLCERLSEEYGFKVFHYNPLIATKDALAWEGEYHFTNNRLDVSSIFGKYRAKSLDRLISQERPAIVIIQEFSLITTELLLLKRKYGFKLISMCDDSIDMILGNDFKWTHRLSRMLLPRFLDNLILNSEQTAQWYRKHFAKGLVLPIIPDEDVFRRRLATASGRVCELRERICPDGRKVVLFVGRAVGLKNIPVLMRSCASLKEKARLVLVGNGEKTEELKALDKKLGLGAYFAGECFGEDLMAMYQLADVFCLPSTREAFGSVVGEALMAGCTVAVSERCGAMTLINESNGLVFDPLSEESLTSAVRRLVERAPQRDLTLLRPSLCPLSFSRCFEDLMRQLIC